MSDQRIAPRGRVHEAELFKPPRIVLPDRTEQADQGLPMRGEIDVVERGEIEEVFPLGFDLVDELREAFGKADAMRRRLGKVMRKRFMRIVARPSRRSARAAETRVPPTEIAGARSVSPGEEVPVTPSMSSSISPIGRMRGRSRAALGEALEKCLAQRPRGAPVGNKDRPMRQFMRQRRRTARHGKIAMVDGGDEGGEEIGIRRNIVEARPCRRHEPIVSAPPRPREWPLAFRHAATSPHGRGRKAVLLRWPCSTGYSSRMRRSRLPRRCGDGQDSSQYRRQDGHRPRACAPARLSHRSKNRHARQSPRSARADRQAAGNP